MVIKVAPVFAEYLAKNRGPDPHDPEMRLRVSEEKSAMAVVISLPIVRVHPDVNWTRAPIVDGRRLRVLAEQARRAALEKAAP